MKTAVTSKVRSYVQRLSPAIAARMIAMITLLMVASFARAQHPPSVVFDNTTSCDFCLVISYCEEGCVQFCENGDVVAGIHVPANNVFDYELPAGMQLRGIKLADKHCTVTLAAWSCEEGWDVNSFTARGCCGGLNNTILVYGDGNTNTLECDPF